MLKNIAAPVQAWRWGGDSAQIAQANTPEVGAKDDAPSVAVLPFTNMSGEPEQVYFSDGISEDIITDLSKVSGLIVIARNSSFAYKGKTPDIRAVGRERIRLTPNADFSRAYYAAALGHLGEVAEAQRVWRELKEINPKYSFEVHIAQLPWRDPAGPARIREGLARVGLAVVALI